MLDLHRLVPKQRFYRRGDTMPFDLQMETDENGHAWASFAQYRVSFTLKRSPEDEDEAALLRLTSDPNGGIFAGTSANWMIPKTLNLEPNEHYFYDVQLENLSAGRVITLEVGHIIVLPDITRSTAA